MRRSTIFSLALLCSASATARGASVEVIAYDPKGRVLNNAALRKHIAPRALQQSGVPVDKSGLLVTEVGGDVVPGRPWWVESSTMAVWRWREADRVRFSLPWPIGKDGFSTVALDGGGEGYIDGQQILLNEEAAVTAYRRMQESLKERSKDWEPAYAPSARTQTLLDRSKRALTEAHAAKIRRRRSLLFDRALTDTSYAWQQIVFEHGRQIAQDRKAGAKLRWGLTLDETAVENLQELNWIARKVRDSGANWVRVVFAANPEDFVYAEERSFSSYDALVTALRLRKIHIMGSVLDSMLWAKGITPELYQQRTNNLVFHFKDSINSWEVASEPNGTWLGGTTDPIPDETILLCVQKAVVEVKRIDPSFETVATLHWWEGTAPDDRHGLSQWVRWSTSRGFGKGLDVVAVSLYPHRHPVGIAFDTIFQDLRLAFPTQKLMLGGWSFAEEGELEGYWWLKPKSSKDARKDLTVLLTGAAASIPEGLGGGFYWGTLQHMFRPGRRKSTSLYRIYQQAIKRVREP